MDFQDVWFNLGRHRKLKDRVGNKNRRQIGSPHKILGVTKKHHYSSHREKGEDQKDA